MRTDNLYRLAWKILPKVPLPVVYSIAHLAADTVWRRNGSSVQQLRRNYVQLLGHDVKERLVRAGVRSYFRSFAQQFTLPGWSPELIDRSCVYPGAQRTLERMKEGPVVLALTHSGNWDLAGAWFCQNYGPILTVAEKLEPPDLFTQFVDFRASIGLEIIGVAPGEHVFHQLVAQAEDRSVLVPLLADRDISGSGVEVELGAGRALVAAGPAALARQLGRPLIAGHISYRKVEGVWQIYAHFTEPLQPPSPSAGETQVEAWTREWVRAVAPIMQEHVVDWHMMQKVFVADLDPERLERARRRAGKKPENED